MTERGRGERSRTHGRRGDEEEEDDRNWNLGRGQKPALGIFWVFGLDLVSFNPSNE